MLGALLGTLNVALSVQAVAVERAVGRPVMATMHGTWTPGAVVGGAAVTSGLRLGMDVRVLMAGGAIALAVAGVCGREDSGRAAAAGGGRGPLSPGLVVTLGVIGAAAFVAERTATDWAGVHATRVLGADPATASLVYTDFFAAMTFVRFVGDAVRARLGAAATMRLAGCTATAGFGLVVLAGVPPWTRRPGSAAPSPAGHSPTSAWRWCGRS